MRDGKSHKPHQGNNGEHDAGRSAPPRQPAAHLAEVDSVRARVLELAADPRCLPDITHPKKRLFVLALAETGNRTQAAAVAGVSRFTPYSPPWRNDLALQAAVRQAQEAAADLIEAEAYRRGVLGWEEPAGWYQGRPGGMVRKYSDVLAIFLLKGLRPDRYKDRVEMR